MCGFLVIFKMTTVGVEGERERVAVSDIYLLVALWSFAFLG